ncbi:thioredoxin H-type-like [Triticum dicoccoides]|uniref:thioredoxin H-type-like n=1 Tax=Triticum dicoccoides TaxID=85692 RepID=UPI00188EEB60|nr:thioredoxin H-type-like [Triticum dicoccoides]
MMTEREDNKLLVIEFTASWCRPSRSIAPFIDFLANKYADAIFLKVDIDEMKYIAEAYEVNAAPIFLFMNNGKVKDTLRGAFKEELFEKLQLQMALIMDN